MKSLPLENPDIRIGAPKNWNHEKDGLCHTLECYLIDNALVSAWRPSKEELKRLNEGQPLYLHIWTAQHPVVALSVGKPVKVNDE
jgi:hypothetical protein